jgi:Flp pilus assembly secretin CpaC
MRKTSLALLGLALLGAAATAEEKTQAPATRKNPTPIKVQVVFARYAGEKKMSSLPYALALGAPGRPARLRMGIEVPMPSVKENVPTVSYHNVGANLDCSAEPTEDGRYKLDLTIEQSSIFAPEGDKKTPAALSSDHPLLRSFNASFTLFLSDGQSASYVLATDPLSGEVLKVDVTMAVLK